MMQATNSSANESSIRNLTDQLKNMFKVNRRELKCFSPEFIKDYDAKMLTDDLKFEVFESARIMRILSCSSVEHLLEILTNENFQQQFNRSSHCFVIVVEVTREGSTASDDFVDKLSTINFSQRPFVIQLSIKISGKTKIFVKASRCNEIRIFMPIDKTLKEKNFHENVFNFNSLLQALYSNIGGSFDGRNLLSCQVDVLKTFKGLKFVDLSARDDDVLSAMFLMMFTNQETGSEAIELAVKQAGPDVVCALLNLPINFSLNAQRMTKLSAGVREIVNESLLCISSEYGKVETLEFLLLCLNYSNVCLQKASNCAFAGRKWENLSTLLANDSPFPDGIKQILEAPADVELQKLKKICEERKRFHQAIRNNDNDEVEKFIEENPTIKVCYGLDNFTSLAVALKAGIKGDNFDMYALLRYHRFSADKDHVHDGFFRNLSDEHKEAITLACQKFYGRPVDSHIFFIYSKTRLGFRYEAKKQDECFERIKGYLDELNKIDDVVPILKVVENSQSLMIVFDFDSDAVHNLDLLSSKSTTGVCYFSSGRIYVACKTSEREVLGTLIHELTHFAMNILFNNKCQPFDESDADGRRKFEEIVERYGNDDAHVPIVKRVFECYPENHYNAEVIVRAPQMIVHYRKDEKGRNKVRKMYDDLFEYYENILATIRTFIRDPSKFEFIRDMQQMNDQLGGLRAIEPSFKNVKLLDEKIFNASNIQLVITNVPKLTQANILQGLKQSKMMRDIAASHIFTSTSDFENEFWCQRFRFVSSSDNNLITFVIKISDGDFAHHKNIWEFVGGKNVNAKFIFICDELQEKFVRNKLRNQHFEVATVEHSWSDLNNVEQRKLLKTEVNFQGFGIKLNQLVNQTSKSMNEFPLKAFYEKAPIMIGSLITWNRGYDPSLYIERTLKNFYGTVRSPKSEDMFSRDETRMLEEVENHVRKFIPKDFSDLLKDALTVKSVILTDEAGKGKSTILTHFAVQLKESLPDYWIIRIDLHEFTDVFKTEFTEDVSNFVSSHLVDLKTPFECLLFQERFADGKVAILLDGLDEIAPYYKAQCLSFLRKLKASTVGQIWVTTRPHLVLELMAAMAVNSWCLEPFTRQNQTNFMVKFWSKKLKLSDNSEQHEKLEECAGIIISRLRQSLADDELDFIGIPLQTYMVAEIFMSDVRKFLKYSKIEAASFDMPNFPNMIWLYRKFVATKIKIVQSEKGELVGQEKADQEVDGVNMIFHHEQLALNEIFGLDLKCEIEKDELQRYGIITFTNEKPQFIHRTYAEYFVANYVTKKFPRFDDDILYKIIFESYRYGKTIDLIASELKNSPRFYQDVELHKKVANFIDQKAPLNQPDDLFFIHRHLYQSSRLVKFILTCVNHCHEKLLFTFLVRIVKEGFNIFILAAITGRKSIVKMIWTLIKERFGFHANQYFLAADIDDLNTFQKIFLSAFPDLKDDNPMLMILYEMAKEILETEELEQLITGWKYRELKIGKKIWMSGEGGGRKFSDESFVKSLDMKWRIAKEFTSKSDNELIEEENLFSGCIRFIIESERDDDDHILAIFLWARKQFSSTSALKTFRERFYVIAASKVDQSSNLRIKEIMKTTEV